MKTFTATRSHTQNFVLEHTPIYDLDDYQKRQRQFKRQKLLKNLLDTAIFASAAGLTFSILFWGV
ncbi:hypothetical protein CAT32_10185 [Acinetobacter baumannii]|uniref:hypothetical protein n=1 Tax=Acinetobacter baumannii TaxID=470 RepID=UPI000A334B67|nr:hypothetical protein [Acinetobacter baumannii]EKX9006697.1 hypothetical protein [Acinetobacter baumannii]OTK29679.1 hypothetical protein B9X43_05965 [Acinetobacter baumannii]OTU67808.1 hypothetical protein CAT32_10185 [Acinetobacter baumannii]HEM7101540.1 hypothetical protein [Acinetobacter baumannii]